MKVFTQLASPVSLGAVIPVSLVSIDIGVVSNVLNVLNVLFFLNLGDGILNLLVGRRSHGRGCRSGSAGGGGGDLWYVGVVVAFNGAPSNRVGPFLSHALLLIDQEVVHHGDHALQLPELGRELPVLLHVGSQLLVLVVAASTEAKQES